MKKFQATKKSISTIAGICFALLALLILLSPNTRLEFLSKGITLAFGFVGFWIILPFVIVLSIYLIVKKRGIKIKANRIFIGVAIIIFALLILLSTQKGLNFQNSSKLFKEANESNKDAYLNTALGGGYIGYVLAGLLNQLISFVGTYIVCIFLIIAGFIVVFFPQIKLGLAKLKEVKKAKKEEKQEEINAVEISTAPEEDEIPFEEIKPQPNINNDETPLKKAHFVMEMPVSSNIVREPQVEEPQVAGIQAEETQIQDQKIENPEEYMEESIQREEVNQPVIEEVAPQEENKICQPPAHLVKDYVYPTNDLLNYHENEADRQRNDASCANRIEIINQTLANFRVGASVAGYTIGPSVTRFDVRMNPGVSVMLINKYIDDLSAAVNGLPLRYESVVYGKTTSGLEIPNEIRTNVGLKEAIEKLPVGEKYLRNIPFGKNISGELLHASLSDFPHLLVSGTTGSGKTIFIHSVIVTLIMRNKPEELKLLLIDPKKVEMNFYAKIPHLLCPVVSDSRKAYVALKKLVDEMERRYDLFQANGSVRDIKGFNAWAKANNVQPLPYIVIFVDEYADLVDTCKEVREPVVRIAQKARAAGIHLVLATQRPSVNIIDGVIKSNIATRVALLSASATDSITIIGEGGAEKLLGNGDMLVESAVLSTTGRPRVQGCFVEEEEIMNVCDFLRDHYDEEYDPNFINLEEAKPAGDAAADVEAVDKASSEEAQYQVIKEQIMHRQMCSISYIQRTYGMGYPRAGRYFARLVKEGVVAPEGDSKGNKVLCYTPDEQQMGTIEQSTFIPDTDDAY